MHSLFKAILFIGLITVVFGSLNLDATAEALSGNPDGSFEADPQEAKQPPARLQVGQGGAPMGRAGQQEAPVAAKIEDIQGHRRRPLEFIRAYEEQIELDLDKVDYNADVLAVVNGEEITQDLLKGYLILFSGTMDLERFIMAKLTEIGIESRIEEGFDPSTLSVSDKRVEKHIQKQMEMQMKQAMEQMKGGEIDNLDIEEWKKNIAATFGWERYKELVRSSLSFEDVYLPSAKPKPADETEEKPKEEAEPAEESADDQEEEEALDPNLPIGTNAQGTEVNIYIPIITWNALSLGEKERGLRDHINEMYKNGEGVGDFLMPHFARSVKEALLRAFDVDYFYSGKLNPGVLVQIEDREVLLDDVYSVIEHKITPEDRMYALREILLCKSMDKVLNDLGYALTDEEFEKAFTEHEKKYEGSLFPLEFIIRLHGYFNKDRYKNIYRRRAGFERMIADEFADDEKMKNFQEGAARLLYENGSVKVQIIFFGVYDSEQSKYREGGWDWAVEQMDKAMAAIESGEDFAAISKMHENPKSTFTTFDFDFLSRNHLRMALADSSKSALITGYSLADYIFYRADSGEVIGPVVKRWGDMSNPVHKGVYLVKVVEFRRSQFLKPYEQNKEMVQTDYADLKFNWWAQECLKAGDIQLTQAQ